MSTFRPPCSNAHCNSNPLVEVFYGAQPVVDVLASPLEHATVTRVVLYGSAGFRLGVCLWTDSRQTICIFCSRKRDLEKDFFFFLNFKVFIKE